MAKKKKPTAKPARLRPAGTGRNGGKPKLYMFINTEGGLKVTAKALRHYLKHGDPTEAEKADAEKLIGRLDARLR